MHSYSGKQSIELLRSLVSLNMCMKKLGAKHLFISTFCYSFNYTYYNFYYDDYYCKHHDLGKLGSSSAINCSSVLDNKCYNGDCKNSLTTSILFWLVNVLKQYLRKSFLHKADDKKNS